MQEGGCVDFVNSTKLPHVIVDASATLPRTRRGWAAVVAGWTAKRKPKRAVGATEGLRCFAAAGALALARGLVARPQGAVCGCLWLPAVVVGFYPTG